MSFAPRLSIITVCHNDAKWLLEQTRSVRKQTSGEWEHLILNNGSSDSTSDVCKTHTNLCRSRHARWWKTLTNINYGLAQNMLFARAYASSQWALKLDADDLAMPSLVEELLFAADSHPEANCIFTPAYVFGPGVPEPYIYTYPPWDKTQVAERHMIPGPCALRRDLWEKHEGMDSNLSCIEDWDFIFRARDDLVPWQVPGAPLWAYRKHALGVQRLGDKGQQALPAMQDAWRRQLLQESLDGTSQS